MTGENLSPSSPEKAALIQKDDSVRRLGVALGANTKEKLSDAVKAITELKSSAIAKGCALAIFEANDRPRQRGLAFLSAHSRYLPFRFDSAGEIPPIAGAECLT